MLETFVRELQIDMWEQTHRIALRQQSRNNEQSN